MINSPGLAGPLSLPALPLHLPSSLPDTAPPDFLSCDLLSLLNNKYLAVDTWKNQKQCNSAESGITLIWASTLIFLQADAWTSPPLVLGGRVQRGGFCRASGQAIAKWRPWELGGFFLFPQVKRPHSVLFRLRSKGPSGALGWRPEEEW